MNTAVQQRLMDLRSEIFSKLADLNSQTMDLAHSKANQEEFRSLIDEKVDISVMKTYMN